MSTHADPSNSSKMQLETPGGVGVSCPCERRATVELKPKTDTGLCVAKSPACNHFFFTTHSPAYTTGFNPTHPNLMWNDHHPPRQQKGQNKAEVLLIQKPLDITTEMTQSFETWFGHVWSLSGEDKAHLLLAMAEASPHLCCMVSCTNVQMRLMAAQSTPNHLSGQLSQVLYCRICRASSTNADLDWVVERSESWCAKSSTTLSPRCNGSES